MRRLSPWMTCINVPSSQSANIMCRWAWSETADMLWDELAREGGRGEPSWYRCGGYICGW